MQTPARRLAGSRCRKLGPDFALEIGEQALCGEFFSRIRIYSGVQVDNEHPARFASWKPNSRLWKSLPPRANCRFVGGRLFQSTGAAKLTTVGASIGW
jgi:hypothetical protein